MNDHSDAEPTTETEIQKIIKQQEQRKAEDRKNILDLARSEKYQFAWCGSIILFLIMCVFMKWWKALPAALICSLGCSSLIIQLIPVERCSFRDVEMKFEGIHDFVLGVFFSSIIIATVIVFLR